MRKRTKIAIGASAGAGALTAAIMIPTLIGGKEAKPGEWPEVVNIRGCTATVVGAQAVLTAAHCVRDEGIVAFWRNGKRIASGPCEHHNGYGKNKTADFALCKIPRVDPPYAEINADHWYVKPGDTLTLMGYGCTQPGGKGGNDGVLRVGSAKVIKVPQGGSNYDIVTKAKAALCYGDSGGPAFKGKRLVGVNSRGNINDTSYLSATHMVDNAFMKDWAKRVGAPICGLGGWCGDQEEEPPKPEPKGSFWEELIMKLLEAISALFK